MDILTKIGDTVVAMSNWLWGPPLLILLGAGGLLLTIRFGFVQFRHIGYIFSQTFGKMFQKTEGGISSFSACTASLAACVGASNITGVPVAIAFGGPGALVWMWILAFAGCATKLCEIALGIKYREKNEMGEYVGGPMYYMKKGIKNKKFGAALAFAFAMIMMLENVPSAATQMVSAIQTAKDIGLPAMGTGIAIILIVAVVALGGINRITKVTDKMVPIMVIVYVIGGLIVLGAHITAIPEALVVIIKSAFSPMAAAGGFAGSSVAAAIRWGAARGAYSNEAGDGAAPFIHSAATVDHPIRQGFFGVFEVFVDTMVVCTFTGLICVVSGAYIQIDGANAATMPSAAFSSVFGSAGPVFITLMRLIFVISTLIVLVQVGTKSAEYCFGIKFARIFRYMYFVGMFFGIVGGLEFIYRFLDFFFALLIISNMTGVLLLHGEVVELLREFFHTPGKYYMKDIEDKKAAGKKVS